jgi:serine/threonine-protein kinase
VDGVSTTPRVLGGRYEVGELIGRGGMADVHLGHDTRLGRTIAIKMLRSDLARDPNFLTRFRREAQSAAGLNHPAIVAIYDSGEDSVEGPGGTHTPLAYIVMEYVDGVTLRDHLTRSIPLDPAEAIRYTEGVLDALAYSHRMGIVHRDIKPGNVMLTTSGQIKVMDFGIARAIADTAATMTATQAVVGTAQYLSPEQAQGQTVDARSDLYSTGCLLFELLTGRTPFTGDSPVAIAYQHVGEQPQPPSVWNPGVGGDLDAVTLHALTKDRDARYQDAQSFRDDLENIRLGRPISAAALGSAAAVGAVATQTMPASYATPGTPTVVQTRVERIHGNPENTAGLPAVGRSEDDARAQRKGNGGKAALITVLVLVLLGLVGWLGVTWFSNQQPPVVTTTVPTLTGLTAEQAASALEAKHLKGSSSEEPNDAPKGEVFKQSPKAGETVNEGSTVTYVVSTGPETVKVPNVVGMNVESATQALKDAGLKVSGNTQENDPSQDKGRVISTDPAIGDSVDKGASVQLHIASGKVEIPTDLVGKQWAVVSNQLANEFKVNPVQTLVDSTDKAPGTVLKVAQGGDTVPVGSDVEVEVAQTPIPTQTVTVTPPPTSSEGPPPPSDTPSTPPTETSSEPGGGPGGGHGGGGNG